MDGTKVCWRSHDGTAEGLLSDDASKAKVAELHLRELGIAGQEHIFRLQIAVDNVLAVEVFQRHQDLLIVPSFIKFLLVLFQ